MATTTSSTVTGVDDKTKNNYNGPIIDSHVHFWDPKNTPRPASPLVRIFGFWPKLMYFMAEYVLFPKHAVLFFATSKHVANNYFPSHYEKDCEQHNDNIIGVVHVQAGWEGDDIVDETRWLEQLDDTSKKIVGIVGEINLSKGPEIVDKVLQDHINASTRIKGVRDMLAWHKDYLIWNAPTSYEKRSYEPKFRESFELLQKYGLTYETFIYYTQLNELYDLAKSYPNQKINLCHIGTPIAIRGPYGNNKYGTTNDDRQQIMNEWKQGLQKLANECPNVYIKLSGWAMPIVGFGYEKRNNDDPPSVDEVIDQLTPLIIYVLDTFGPDRCMFGSNFPVDKASLPLSIIIDAMKYIICQHLTPEDQENVFYTTTCSFYGIHPSK